MWRVEQGPVSVGLECVVDREEREDSATVVVRYHERQIHACPGCIEDRTHVVEYGDVTDEHDRSTSRMRAGNTRCGGDDAIDAIVAEFEAAGAVCKVSSIHVNGWYGHFDKLSGCAGFLADRWGSTLEDAEDTWLYVGDSANDEPMFSRFSMGIGVANVVDFLPRMKAWPRYVTQQPGGAGFADIIDRVLEFRSP